VIPLFGEILEDLEDYLCNLSSLGLHLVLVDNNPRTSIASINLPEGAELLFNGNSGGIAGGFNRGVQSALAAGSTWITLLDQDSRIEPREILLLSSVLDVYPRQKLLVGPSIWDEQRQERHGRWQASQDGLDCTRLLISSGTTFRSSDWTQLGCMHEGLFIDFVDHAWCFRAQARGFQLRQHPSVRLRQRFGAAHPNAICRRLGMQLYRPERHFYSVRNLRWLCFQRDVPLDLKIKELLKMLVKPWLWLAFEPHRLANLKAIVAGLFAPLPARY
jgi:rhamnosyltransferase